MTCETHRVTTRPFRIWKYRLKSLSYWQDILLLQDKNNSSIRIRIRFTCLLQKKRFVPKGSELLTRYLQSAFLGRRRYLHRLSLYAWVNYIKSLLINYLDLYIYISRDKWKNKPIKIVFYYSQFHNQYYKVAKRAYCENQSRIL